MDQITTGVLEVELPDTFGERLALARRVRGWSQDQLAAAVQAAGLQLFQAQISHMESGKRQANALERAGLAFALNVPAAHFFVTEESHPTLARMDWEVLSGLLRDIRWYGDPCLLPAGMAV